MQTAKKLSTFSETRDLQDIYDALNKAQAGSHELTKTIARFVA
jgi:hypothetical protein